MDYRYPARNVCSTQDVNAAMKLLEKDFNMSKFVLVGWSFGGAPIFTVGGMNLAVVGCATVASQTAETSGIRRLAPRPVLLLHGTADQTLSASCSQMLYSAYGSDGKRRLHFFEDDDHALTKNSAIAEELLCEFITGIAGVPINDREQVDIVRQKLMTGDEKIELMEKGGDLRGTESIE